MIYDIPEWSIVSGRLDRCMDRLAEQDEYLMKHDAGERAVAHRIAVYLEQEFPGWHVDCEYNREAGTTNPKKIRREPEASRTIATPDIIVHHRGPEGPNLLAIEVKPNHRHPDTLEEDRLRLKAYVRDHKYAHAAFITYGVEWEFADWDVEHVIPEVDNRCAS
jgi:hypothetical protein